MAKRAFEKPGNLLYPVPAVLVGCAGPNGEKNLITVAWAGTICSDPPMLSISVRPGRYSYGLIRESGEFSVNLVTERLVSACDYCGCRSGRDVDKFAECHLTAETGEKIAAPSVLESPVSLECRVAEERELGSHTVFLAEIVNVRADERYFDKNGTFHLEAADLITYSHGSYYSLGEKLGTFGYSVRKKKRARGAGKHA